MLNHLLSALGLPKRTEINTTQTPALRRIAGLEDAVEDLQDRLKVVEAYALECEKAIVALKRMCWPAKASPKASPKATPKATRRAKP